MSYLKDLYKEAEKLQERIENLDIFSESYESEYIYLYERLESLRNQIIQEEENLDNEIID